MIVITRKHLGSATALLLAMVIMTGFLQPGRPTLPPGSFRVSVQHLIREEDVLMTLVEIEARSGSPVNALWNDRPAPSVASDFGAIALQMPEPDLPFRPWWQTTWPLSLIVSASMSPTTAADRHPSRIKLTILGDRVKYAGADLLKVHKRLDAGWATRSLHSTNPYPGEKPIADVLSVLLQSGTYPEGTPVPLMIENGQTIRLLVDPPKD